MKKLLLALGLVSMVGTGAAMAGTQYHVYKKKGSNKCEIDMRTHKAWRSGRGSGWVCLGHFSNRTDAQKLFKKSGCKR